MVPLIVRVLVASVLVLFLAGGTVLLAQFLLDRLAQLTDPFFGDTTARGGFARFETAVLAGFMATIVAMLVAIGGAYKLGRVMGRSELYETALNAQGRIIDLVPRVDSAQAACLAAEMGIRGPVVERRRR